MSTRQDMSAIKRPTEDASSNPAKRLKNGATPGTPTAYASGPPTPGLMGPPGAASLYNAPAGAAKAQRKDDGLDAGDPNDMFAHVGINLQDEERNMVSFDLPANAATVQQQRWMQQQWQSETQPPMQAPPARAADLLDRSALTRFMNKTLESHGLRAFEPDVYHLLGLSLTERLTNLMQGMLVLAKHRRAPPPAGPGIRQRDDIGRTLRALAIKEAAEEERARSVAATRRQEAELRKREQEEATATAGQRKRAQTAAAKGLSESTMARNANATANLMLNTSGGKKYSWMTGGGGTPGQKPRRAAAGPGSAAAVFRPGQAEEAGVLLLKDYIVAAEEEQESLGRGGRSLLRAYTLLKD